MTRAIFHIGTNKTGSSAIQNFLSSNPDFLAAHGLLYPRATRKQDTGHHALAQHATEYDDMFDATVAIESEYASSKLRQGMIFSSEVFHTVEPFMLSRFFKDYDMQVVVFLRPHLDYYSSWYREGVKSHNFTWDFPSFLEYAARPYSPWLDTWSKVIGTDNVIPILYDRKDFPQGSATSAFLRTILPDADIPDTKDIREEKNPSISGNLLHIKRLLNENITLEQAHDIVYDIRKLCDLDPTFTGGWKMPEEYVDLISTRFQEDQRSIFETYGIDLSISTDSFRGSISPNDKTLYDDKKLIFNFSQENNLLITKFLEKHS